MNDLDDVPLKQNPRLQLLFLPPVLAGLALVAALAWKQFGRAAELKEQEQFQTRRQIVTPGSRGIITDRNGNILAENVPRLGIALDLGRMKPLFRARYRDLRNRLLAQRIPFNSGHLEEQARFEVVGEHVERVNRLLGRSYLLTSRQIESHLGNRRLLPLPIARDLSEEEFARLMEVLEVDSPFEKHVTVARRYPHGSAACHTLGYVSERDRLSLAAVVRPERLVESLRAEAVKIQNEAREAGLPPAEAAEALAQAAPRVLQPLCDRLGEVLGRKVEVDDEAVRAYYERLSGSAVGPYLRPRKGAPINLFSGLTDSEGRRLRELLPPDFPVEFRDSLERHGGEQGEEPLGAEVASAEGTRGLITFRERGLSGLEGVELSLEDELRGEDGHEIWLVDPAATRQVLLERKEPAQGKDLALSLDVGLQKATESALGSGFGAAAMVDVKTGEVLVIASKPDFDPNLFSPRILAEDWEAVNTREAGRSLALKGLYPPASTFKIVTSLAAMRAGVFDSLGSVVCTGHVTLGGFKFHCHERMTGHSDPPDYRPLNFEQAMMVSCNPFFYKTGLTAGVDRLSETAVLLGLDQPTGVELPNEAGGMIVPTQKWKRENAARLGVLPGWFEGDTANFSIGQGFLRVTPLQMAALTASVARGETRTKLTLRKLADGAIIDHGGGPLPISAAHLAQLRHSLELVTMGRDGDWRGTALNVPPPGLKVAGKTGTAQFQHKGTALNLAWFVGYAPADNPKVALVVLIEGRMPDPVTPGGFLVRPVSGGKVAGAVARQMLDAWQQSGGH